MQNIFKADTKVCNLEALNYCNKFAAFLEAQFTETSLPTFESECTHIDLEQVKKTSVFCLITKIVHVWAWLKDR